ncbi:MAG: hypothetical protein K1X79_03270 [Oligoflexia bacterium]|nr:hypothetical protein [Oligoflexia bacterium]
MLRLSMGETGIVVITIGGHDHSTAQRGCPAQATFRQVRGGLPTHPISTSFEETGAGQWKVWLADGSSRVVGDRRQFARFPISAPCARSSIRAVSDDANGTPGAYECQYVEAVLAQGGMAYMGAQRVVLHGYQGWLLLDLPDGTEKAIYFTGPDQYGIPRVWELVVYRRGDERHTRILTPAEQKLAPRFKIVPDGKCYSVKLVK